MSKTKKVPNWVYVLRYLFVAGKPITNAELAKRFNIGYALRNELCESGKIEVNGVNLNRVRVDGKSYKLYSIKTESLQLAESILIEYSLVKKGVAA